MPAPSVEHRTKPVLQEPGLSLHGEGAIFQVAICKGFPLTVSYWMHLCSNSSSIIRRRSSYSSYSSFILVGTCFQYHFQILLPVSFSYHCRCCCFWILLLMMIRSASAFTILLMGGVKALSSRVSDPSTSSSEILFR